MTLRRNRAQHRPGLYYQALCIAMRRVRASLIDRGVLPTARAAVLRASFRVRSVLADGFFLPLATCWYASLARILVLLDHLQQSSERKNDEDDVGLLTKQQGTSAPVLQSRRAVDIIYSSDSDSSSSEKNNEAAPSQVRLVIDRSFQDASQSLLFDDDHRKKRQEMHQDYDHRKTKRRRKDRKLPGS
eukprot:CAMPEP_0197318970 /NCGR_PEP_ID=MMETSP0891-20130614/52831_1 /TAXON_ID=44058 ORGANISM="Aureoumbra lagunensis, Strain CCMP1510" /NCGR_SAMPLE_ID=MMETSP0891 /ASSEMBLY_ACC=CAM_ASM_000534 /LENGTH=186 /DNA_ID=CAMNT_0042809639 /DNA_START=1 /DNA_END=561 /DNA_ORIENTATION=-